MSELLPREGEARRSRSGGGGAGIGERRAFSRWGLGPVSGDPPARPAFSEEPGSLPPPRPSRQAGLGGRAPYTRPQRAGTGRRRGLGWNPRLPLSGPGRKPVRLLCC
ncbi:unnamed protein product [Eretmochelys imbricata]